MQIHEHLLTLLRSDHERHCRVAASTVFWVGITLLGIVMTLLLIADLFMAIPVAGRGALFAAWILGWGVTIFLYFVRRREPFHEERSALRLQQRASVEGGQVLNAVQLLREAPPHTSASLRGESIARGDHAAEIATHQSAHPAHTRRHFRRGFACLFALVALAGILWPGALGTVTARFLMPWGDFPPHTWLRFDIVQNPDPVPLNKPITLVAHIEGPGLPTTAEAVFLDEQGNPTRAAMWSFPNPIDPSTPKRISFSLPLPALTSASRFFIDTPKGRSPTQRLHVSNVPLLEGATVHIQPPDYTARPATEARLTSHKITALRGSTVTLTLQSNTALGLSPIHGLPAQIESSTPTVLAPLSNDVRRVAASWNANISVDVEAILTALDGTPADSPLALSLVVTEDAPPIVRIDSPDAIVIAPDDWTVEISASASDDIRVEKMQLQVSVQSSFAPMSIPLDNDRKNPAQAAGVVSLSLPEIGAKAGSTVRYFATATDNRPGKAGYAESEVHEIKVISRAEYDALMRANYTMEDWLDELNETLATIDAFAERKNAALKAVEDLLEKAEASPDDPSLAAELRKANSALGQLIEDMDQLSEAMNDRANLDTLHEWERPYKQWLQTVADQLDEQIAAAERLNQSLTAKNLAAPENNPARERMQEFAEMNQPFDGQPATTEEREEAWEQMMQAMHMQSLAQEIQAITTEQRTLADRLTSLNDQPPRPEDEAARDHLAHQQSTLKSRLEEATRQLREAAEHAQESLPTMSESAVKIATTIEELHITLDQQQAADSLTAASLPPAAASAISAATKLESLASACESQCANASNEIDKALSLAPPSMNAAMRDALAQALMAQPGLAFGRIGGSGAGNAGSSSLVGMLGPRYPLRGNSLSMRAMDARGGNAKSTATGSTTEPEMASENVEPGRFSDIQRRAALFNTIPERYRPHAEAYFTRLNADQTQPSVPPSPGNTP